MIPVEKPFDRDDTETLQLRRIAILLNALPEATHRVLLGQLDTDEKSRVRIAVDRLEEIDTLEQHRVVKDLYDRLRAETENAESIESEIQDEIQIGRARVSKKRSNAIYRSTEPGEDNGAEQLPETPSDGTSPQQHRSTAPEQTPHLFPMHTDVLPGSPIMLPASEDLKLMISQFHSTQAAGVLPENAGAASLPSQPTALRHSDPNPNQTESLQFSGREATRSMRDQTFPPRRNDADGIPRESISESEELARHVDEYLVQLPADELCMALGYVSTKQAFLTLCGLPNEKAETVIAMLPKRQAKKVRYDMRRMGRLQLTEIDDAKRNVAEIAIRVQAGPRAAVA